MYKIIIFIPVNNLEEFKATIFNTGAGQLGNYSHCSFELIGTGQFKALDGANPAIGDIGVIEKVEEARLEFVVREDIIENIIKTIYEAHPYEEPAFDIIKLENDKFQHLKAN